MFTSEVYKPKHIWLLSAFLILCGVAFLCYSLNVKRRIFPFLQGFTTVQHSTKVDLAQLFVPQGKRYNSKEGIIYECITRRAYSQVEPLRTTRDFRSDSWSKPGEDKEARVRSFKKIFETQSWYGEKPQNSDKLSPEYRASGPGSALEEAQRPLALLNCLVDRLKDALRKPVITMVDIPCGDFFWMRHFVDLRTDIHYTGIDIVPTLITRHKINFRNMTHAQFENRDIVTAGLNRSYDIIFCRDMLQHLTTADVMTILDHFSKSGSKLLVTTNLLSSENVEFNLTGTGRFRNLNLMLPPINLVPPVCSIVDKQKTTGIKELSIWTLPLHQRLKG